MRWTLRPRNLLRLGRDGSYWTAGHPGYCDLIAGWHFWRLRKAIIGWIVDKATTIRFSRHEDWPSDLTVIRYR